MNIFLHVVIISYTINCRMDINCHAAHVQNSRGVLSCILNVHDVPMKCI